MNKQARQIYTQFRFGDQDKFLYRAERKVKFEVRVKLSSRLQLYHHEADPPSEIHGNGARNSPTIAES